MDYEGDSLLESQNPYKNFTDYQFSLSELFFICHLWYFFSFFFLDIYFLFLVHFASHPHEK